MDRESKEIVTPVDGHKVVIKTYLTGREYREVENVFFSQAKISGTGQTETSMDGGIVKKAEDVLIQQSVISVDGNTEGILDVILDMKNGDFAFIVKELNDMKYGAVDEKKKLQS